MFSEYCLAFLDDKQEKRTVSVSIPRDLWAFFFFFKFRFRLSTQNKSFVQGQGAAEIC